MQKTLKFKTILGYAGWFIIYTALVLGLGFYIGSNYQSANQASTQKAIQAAVKAATPAPVAEVPQSK